MLYADYTYYISTYNGTLSETLFNHLIIKASREIDKNVNCELTGDIIATLSEAEQNSLKYVACELVDLLNRKVNSDNSQATSITIDGVKKDYKTISNEDYKISKLEILDSLPTTLTGYL